MSEFVVLYFDRDERSQYCEDSGFQMPIWMLRSRLDSGYLPNSRCLYQACDLLACVGDSSSEIREF